MYGVTTSLYLVCLLFVSGGLCAIVPSYIHPCNEATDKCITQAVRDAVPDFTRGSPELGVLPLDPFRVDEISLILPGNLKLSVTNTTFIGLRKCSIEKASLKGTTFDMHTRCNITIKGKYKANGRILLFPINGNGDAKIKVSNIKFHIRMYTKNEIASDGKYHVVFKDYKITHEWGDNMEFKLSNLFEGNPEISNTVLSFINQNWRIVADELGAPIVDVVVKRVIANIKTFFAVLPYEDIIHTPLIL